MKKGAHFFLVACLALMGCGAASGASAQDQKPQLTWTVIDSTPGWTMETACYGDIRLFRYTVRQDALTAVQDTTCAK